MRHRIASFRCMARRVAALETSDDLAQWGVYDECPRARQGAPRTPYTALCHTQRATWANKRLSVSLEGQ